MRIAKDLRKKISEHINEGFVDEMQATFVERFNVKLETSYNIFAMAMVSRREDERDFTPEQAAYVAGFEAGYMAAIGKLEPKT